MATLPSPLLRRITCPHCWQVFPPEEILWISAHEDLHGDPRLGADHLQRFLPTRFTVEGNALDGKGFPCQGLACPKCHLPVPRALLEIEPFFVSILGTPGCGKSYFLAAMTWELRQNLPRGFNLSFNDADPSSNRVLNDYEDSLFLNPHAAQLVPLADLIRKTEEQGELYETVRYGNQTVSYPRPFLFTLQPREQHPHYAAARASARVLCLYDNAGESFQVGKDSTSSPVTQHLAQSRLLMFLFDPTQDTRFRTKLASQRNGDGGLAKGRTTRQATALVEAADRIRRYTGLPHGSRHPHPLMVVATKFDAWSSLLGGDAKEPFVNKGTQTGLDREHVEDLSRGVKDLLEKTCSEVVHTAENFAQTVIYVPVSALGRGPVDHPVKGPAIRPADIKPKWVTVPLLYGLGRCVPNLVVSYKRKGTQGGAR